MSSGLSKRFFDRFSSEERGKVELSCGVLESLRLGHGVPESSPELLCKTRLHSSLLDPPQMST
jgi:hypothetical protein